MANTNIGEAYLQIRPSMEGVKGEIEEAMGDAGAGGARSFGSSFGSGIKVMAGAAGAAAGLAATGITAITNASVSSYAEYEQLAGGIETLFGDSAEQVIANAEQAFNSAGMSSNEYMETSIQSAAALINSLEGDTAKAADLMDMSITDMADNVNKMGTSMEAVQNAYRGFSRGNFTMLDNLALGFAGTKEGMQELLDKAQEISGVEYDISSYSDIVEAIHVVQEEMGISGTTAAEAAGTISGSMSSVKAAWSNLVTGFSDPSADLGTLIGNVVATGTTALQNIMPTIVNALSGIAQALPMIVPIITEQLPTLIQQILPPLIEATSMLLQALCEALPEILGIIIEMLPSIFTMLIDTILTMLPLLVDLALQLVMALADGLIEALPTLIPAVVEVILTIVDKLTQPDTLVMLVQAALQLMVALAEGIVAAMPQIIAKAPEIIMNLVEAIIQSVGPLATAAAEILLTIATGIVDNLSTVIEKGEEIIGAVKDGIFNKIEEARDWGKDMIENFISGIKDKWEKLKNTVTDLASTIKSLLGFSEPEEGPLSNFHTYAPDMMNLFAEGIRDNIGVIEGALGTMASAIKGDFTADYTMSGVADPNERLYGLMGDNMAVAGGGDIVIPVYIGQEKLDTIILNAQQRHNLVSGGR